MIKLALFLTRAVALSVLVYCLFTQQLYSDAALLAMSTLIGLFIVCFIYNLSVFMRRDYTKFWEFKKTEWAGWRRKGKKS